MKLFAFRVLDSTNGLFAEFVQLNLKDKVIKLLFTCA